MLDSILREHGRQLEQLAQAWLSAGATNFALRLDVAPPVSWPTGQPFSDVTMCAGLNILGRSVGVLLVSGLRSQFWQKRLNADAELLSAILTTEDALVRITELLVDTRDQLLAVFDLTQATRDLLQIDQLLDVLATETTRLFEAEGAFYAFDTLGRNMITCQYPRSMIDHSNLIDCLRSVQDSGEPLIVGGDEKSSPNSNWNNLLLAPIKIQGKIMAVLGVIDKHDGPFTAADVKLVRAVGEHAGAHLEKWLLYEEQLIESRLRTELDLAESIQAGLLPRHPPAVPGIDLWGETRSALQVGGDFFDFSLHSDGPLTFSVGDVSGKGMSASLLMAMARIVVRSKVGNRPAPSLSDVISGSSEALYTDFSGANRFVTIFVGRYDPATRALEFANAGHSPVIYCPSGGEPRLLEADSMPLGILAQSFAEVHRLYLQPGDLLVVGTDGLTEARRENDQLFGHERLMDSIKSLRRRSARAIAEGLYQAVDEFNGSSQREDDQTLVVLKICDPQDDNNRERAHN